jgi:hypothetical protein
MADILPVLNNNLDQGLPGLNGGRLSLSSSFPVFEDLGTGYGTIYYIPFLSDAVYLYDGALWQRTTFDPVSIKTSDTQTCTTVSSSTTMTVTDSTQFARGMVVSGTNITVGTKIATITDQTTIELDTVASGSGTQSNSFKIPANSIIDIWGILKSDATLGLRFGNIWSAFDTRTDAVYSLDGYQNVNDADINSGDFNSIGANLGLLLGLARTTSTAGLVEDSTAFRGLANKYNRLRRPLKAVDTTDSWTYTTATFREFNGGTTLGVSRVGVLLIESNIQVFMFVNSLSDTSSGTSNRSRWSGVGLDGATSTSVAQISLFAFAHVGIQPSTAVYQGAPGAGYRTFHALEASEAASTTTWYGDNGSTFSQSGLVGFADL